MAEGSTDQVAVDRAASGPAGDTAPGTYPGTDRATTIVRVFLALYGATIAAIGLWAAAFPASFYADFPGFGRVWVAVDGPYNEHLVRDVGSLNLALAALLLAAAVRTTPLLVGVAAGVNLVNAVPHLTYHLRHLGVYDTTDQVANLIVLANAVIVPLGLLAWVRRRSA